MPPKKRGGRRGKSKKTIEPTEVPVGTLSLGEPSQHHGNQQSTLPVVPTPIQCPKSSPPVKEQSLENVQSLKVVQPGKNGKGLPVETNHFEIDLGTLKETYRYDVEITSVPATTMYPKKLNARLVTLFKEEHFPNVVPAYDGKKLLFSVQKLSREELAGEVDVAFENRKFKFLVTIKFTGIVDLRPKIESNLLQKKYFEREALQCLDVVFASVFLSPTYTRIGRAAYALEQPGSVKPLDGMNLCFGHFQSIAQGAKPFLNVDVSHKLFTKEISIVLLIMEIFKGYFKGALQTFQRKQLESFLKNLRVTYQVGSMTRKYTVNGLGDSSSCKKFELNGQPISVQNYFLQKYRVCLKYPDLPTLWVGNKDKQIFVPLEVCTLIGGQPIEGTDKGTRDLIQHSATSTVVRKQKIQGLLQEAKLNESPCLQEFGFRVKNEFEKLDARVLESPKMEVGGNSGNTKQLTRNGEWRTNKFIRGATITKWTIACLGWMDYQRPPIEDMGKLAQMILDLGRGLGMSISEPEKPFCSIQRRDLQSFFKKRESFDLFVIILQSTDKTLYYEVKQVAELKIGCLTQCLQKTTLEKCSRSLSQAQNTVRNLLLKINTKLDGLNHHFVVNDSLAPIMKNTMFMGADVTHPGPRAPGIPSVVAVTSTCDQVAAKYNTCMRLQPPRTEIIRDMKNIVASNLEFYKNQHKCLPRRIIYFRDGVSEGEFDKVLHQEVESIRSACRQKKYNPKITCIIVVKRHHTRFFPINHTHPLVSDKTNFNVPPGTCVDEVIVDPTLQNFYLVSHASPKGVARPTRYVTIYDENGLSNDEVQELAYNLCHNFMRCTKSVSYPAPTYFSHCSADRAKTYLHGRHLDIEHLNQQLVQAQAKLTTRCPMFWV